MEVTVLNKFAFFWPIWYGALLVLKNELPSRTYSNLPLCIRHDDHLRLVHRGTAYDWSKADPLAPTYDAQFTYHLWQSLAWDRYLSPYDPDRIHNIGAKVGAEREEDGASDESSFSRFARQFVDQEVRVAWRQAVKDGLV